MGNFMKGIFHRKQKAEADDSTNTLKHVPTHHDDTLPYRDIHLLETTSSSEAVICKTTEISPPFIMRRSISPPDTSLEESFKTDTPHSLSRQSTMLSHNDEVFSPGPPRKNTNLSQHSVATLDDASSSKAAVQLILPPDSPEHPEIIKAGKPGSLKHLRSLSSSSYSEEVVKTDASIKHGTGIGATSSYPVDHKSAPENNEFRPLLKHSWTSLSSKMKSTPKESAHELGVELRKGATLPEVDSIEEAALEKPMRQRAQTEPVKPPTTGLQNGLKAAQYGSTFIHGGLKATKVLGTFFPPALVLNAGLSVADMLLASVVLGCEMLDERQQEAMLQAGGMVDCGDGTVGVALDPETGEVLDANTLRAEREKGIKREFAMKLVKMSSERMQENATPQMRLLLKGGELAVKKGMDMGAEHLEKKRALKQQAQNGESDDDDAEINEIVVKTTAIVLTEQEARLQVLRPKEQSNTKLDDASLAKENGIREVGSSSCKTTERDTFELSKSALTRHDSGVFDGCEDETSRERPSLKKRSTSDRARQCFRAASEFGSDTKDTLESQRTVDILESGLKALDRSLTFAGKSNAPQAVAYVEVASKIRTKVEIGRRYLQEKVEREAGASDGLKIETKEKKKVMSWKLQTL